MNTVESDVLAVANQVAPQSPAVEAIQAVADTIADPSPTNIIADVELALKLAKKLKVALSNMHPTVTNVIKALL